MKILVQIKKNIFFLVAIQILLTSCMNYYKVSQPRLTTNQAKARTIDSLKQINKVLILRSSANAMLIQNAMITRNGDSLFTTLGELPQNHLFFVNGLSGKQRYRTEIDEQKNVINEAHIYVDVFNKKEGSADYGFNLSQVKRIEVVERDEVRSAKSKLVGGILITVGVIAIIVSAAVASVANGLGD